MRQEPRSTWVETPDGGFWWDPNRDRLYDPAGEYERPCVYAELPPRSEPNPEDEDDYYRPRRGVVVL